MYMVYQQLTTAIRDGYRGADHALVEHQLDEARRAARWLASLEIDPAQRASLLEPIGIIEEALAEIARTRATQGGDDGQDGRHWTVPG